MSLSSARRTLQCSAQTKAGELEQKPLSIEEELETTRASYEGQLEHQKKVTGDLSAAQKKAEELLQSRQTKWQSERTFQQKAIELLQQTMEEKQHKWSEKEHEMSSRKDELDRRMTEMSQNKPEDKKCCFCGLFKYSGYE